MKKNVVVIIALMLLLTACNTSTPSEPEYNRYTNSFLDTFNTLTVVIGYTETEEEFNNYFDIIHQRFQDLHALYDIYNDYEGINNIKTINDNAGVKPVEVHEDLINLILTSQKWNAEIGPRTNIAFGPVTKIWNRYRNAGIDDPENAKIPELGDLQRAAQLTDINEVIVDKENNTVFLQEGMSLDVGAIAKGYAVELVSNEIEEMGFISGIISGGGNVRVIGKPLDGVRARWGIGIQDPDASIISENKNLDTVFITDASVVSSGDYQRFYYADGQYLHHIIDPATLMPGKYYRAVTIVAKDSGLADFLSTELFLMPYEESFALAESLDGVEVVWVMPDGELRATDGMKAIMSSHGATSTD